MHGEFVSESIEPVPGTFDARGMTAGAPGLPKRFVWRDDEYSVAEVIETWKERSPCKHGSGEQYVRKHWFRIRTTGGEEMKLYFERQARSQRESRKRWWLYTITTAKNTEDMKGGDI